MQDTETMNKASGIESYQVNEVTSNGPEKTIALLYEAIQRHMMKALAAAEAKDYATRSHNLNAAQAIISELRSALDHEIGAEISQNLESLLEFMFSENLSYLVDQEPGHLENVLRVLAPLVRAWRQVPSGAAEKALQQPAPSRQEPTPSGESRLPEDGLAGDPSANSASSRVHPVPNSDAVDLTGAPLANSLSLSA
jgi:flagellar protein FliS